MAYIQLKGSVLLTLMPDVVASSAAEDLHSIPFASSNYPFSPNFIHFKRAFIFRRQGPG
jgi:hypothetical protein